MEVGVLLDRFYYLKAVDASLYDKNAEQIAKDYRYFVKCLSTDRIQIFSDDGNMYTIKVQDIIKNQVKRNSGNKKKDAVGLIGKLSDKGIQIFDFCNMERDANLLFMGCPEQSVSEALLFVDGTGKAKKVLAAAFDTKNKCIAACSRDTILVAEISKEGLELVARSRNGYFVRVSVDDVPVKGKGAAGNKLMSLSPEDVLEEAWIGTTQNEFLYGEQMVKFTRIKSVKMGSKGTKIRI